MTIEQMLSGCIANNAAAQEALYHRFSPKMLGVCYRFAKNREDAEDMLQEGFIKVFMQIQQFRGEGSLEGWIRRIVVHTCINILKKNKKFNESVDIIHANGLMGKDDFIPSIIQAKQVVECIRALPLGYKTVLNLYALEGFSHKEIGEILDIEESTSRSQYTRARIMLEDMLVKKNIIHKNTIKLKALRAVQ
ncbi:MAG: sigma-70 family RNA polymerase sigma factor [Chitinophagaceae bacterium]|jgi:RNA polymerase sigma-70 factor (ECF subfamily)|nr:sigma-70 family RNA polymerase sigma factor [Chitinophagaceae bacterium]MBP6046482.1 sigma-70 family RNA polymerase sigma factor [Ferruginibacter sp.]MBK7089236.1 sigma-70 family RNA polymerase sigma factor [Chitinophagaceae bacterium]MBK7347593.1 sigma-70 family RNA polymerase sigma factor [Chitinophagaceae bacterium]MBK8773694.1 sigma-70 family RNA polymerase sigma factor [Chitinophagaceae bacterium]